VKHKTSVSLEEETIFEMRKAVREGLFRNKSHIMEYSIKKILKEMGKKQENG